ncbi:transglutaminase-like domain-containing protein [Desulfonema magnum]|uniref:Transglutaminase domain-containing protein n=1 Tax=Desulfonema magnum TaxID=45655 RepID=A0A975BMC8_9BACT|nr:transglutaminase-like domain-containing protein [Desulfonema magnum]QTA88116.1 Transglutaminase domain-containing protein [Desulfonema magnum]
MKADNADSGDTDKKYLSPTAIIDSDHPKITAYAEASVKGAGKDPVAKAVKLYYAVRDDIWYDPYVPFCLRKHYRASNVLKNGRGFCISKASLLCAAGRACGIPARVGFATVRNHLATKALIEFIGSDLFVYHGFVEFYLEGKWVKATPTFNAELCKRHKVKPLEFNGRDDSLFHAYNTEQEKFMEYVKYHGTYADIPVDIIVAEWKKVYGRDRVRRWIKDFDVSEGKPERSFHKENVV